jgi:hypothetical protein
MLEWKPRLVLLVLVVTALAVLLGWAQGLDFFNYGW